MQLSELFVSHKQVEPITFTKNDLDPYVPIYQNLGRARAATSTSETSNSSSETTEDDMSTWRVGKTNINSDQQNGAKQSSTGQQNGAWENPYRNNKDKWVKDITAAYQRQGLNANAIKNLIAKNVLESGWGNSTQGAWNFGNITTGAKWSGNYVDGHDKDVNGNPITNRFRSYKDLDDYVKDEIQFLTNLYDFNQNDNFDTFIGKLLGNNSGKRRYAEARNYADSVRRVYNSI